MTKVSMEYEVRSDVLKNAAQKSRSDAEALVKKFLTQAQRDALSGTFGEYPPELFAPVSGEFEQFKALSNQLVGISNQTEDDDLDEGRLRFTLELDSGVFENPKVGLQHLIGILVSDLFSRSRLVLDSGTRITGSRLDLGPVGDTYLATYVSQAHALSRIRDVFNLDGVPDNKSGRLLRLPLMAFSFKPRVGISQKYLRKVTLGVLKAGFNLVELDTRNLQTGDPAWCKFFVQLAREASEIRTHVARFSPNLTMPANEAIETAEQFRTAHSTGPWVVKVDGGLDGLSTIQALRRHYSKEQQPIITCYPLLNRALEEQIGKHTLFEFLTLSGADIIYPGGTPRLSAKNIGISLEQIEVGYKRYWSIIDRGRPMPSIAGGIHAGHLAAYHEMFGPSVAYFLGGALALHKRGAFSGHADYKRRAGAELCVEIIRAAARMEQDVSPDYGTLLEQFGNIRDEYAVDPVLGTDTEQWEYQNPPRYIKGAIRRYTLLARTST